MSRSDSGGIFPGVPASPSAIILHTETFGTLANHTGMRIRAVLPFVVAMLSIFDGASAAAAEDPTPVVVELFTSEACSSCPPADALLSRLNQQHIVNGAEVLTLGEHVDYFNHLGWSDRFSSPLFTQRQNGYAQALHLAGAYTPQIIIDGRYEALGSDAASIEREIGLAAGDGKSAKVSLNWTAHNALNVSVAGASGEPLTVLLAITEDGLTTSVASGENSGQVLRHNGIVRELRQLGVTSGGIFAATAAVVPSESWKTRNLRFVVFVQKPGNGPIVGAAAIRLPPG